MTTPNSNAPDLDLVKTDALAFDAELIDISKADGGDDGPGYAEFTICKTGVPDKHGDVFMPGSLYLERGKGTLSSHEHSFVPAGVFTLEERGGEYVAKVEFLSGPVGQNTREYIQKMGKAAQFSFAGRVEGGREYDNDGNRIIKKALVVEATPTVRGVGDTRLLSIKSDNSPAEPTKEAVMPEEQGGTTATNSEQTPQWALDLQKSMADVFATLPAQVGQAVAEAVKPPEPERTPPNITGDPNEFHKSDDDPFFAKAIKRNALGFFERDGDEVFDIVKALYNQPDFKRAGERGPNIGFAYDMGHNLDIMKATVVDVGGVFMRDRTRLVATPVDNALDMIPMRPVSGNTAQVPLMSDDFDNVPLMNPPDPQGSQTVGADATTQTQLPQPNEVNNQIGVIHYPVETLIFNQPVSRNVFEDDPSAIAAEVMRMVNQARRRLLQQVMYGGSTVQFPSGAVTVVVSKTGRQLVGLVPTITSMAALTSAPDANSNILGDNTAGLEQAIFDVMNYGSPNMISLSAADKGKAYTALRNNRFAIGIYEGGRVEVVGIPIVVNPYMAQNTAILGEFSEENHYIGMRRDIRLETSDEAEFGSDNVVFKATLRAANCIARPHLFHTFTATNNWRPDPR